MQLLNLIKYRRSIRKYQTKQISRDDLKTIIEAEPIIFKCKIRKERNDYQYRNENRHTSLLFEMVYESIKGRLCIYKESL